MNDQVKQMNDHVWSVSVEKQTNDCDAGISIGLTATKRHREPHIDTVGHTQTYHLAASTAFARSASISALVLDWSITREGGGGMGEAGKDSSATGSVLLESASDCLRKPGIPAALAARVPPSVGVVGPASPNALRARPSTAGLILDAGDGLDADIPPFPSRVKPCVALLRGDRFHRAHGNIRGQDVGYNHHANHAGFVVAKGQKCDPAPHVVFQLFSEYLVLETTL